jgi:endo-1,4-beta-mannosidase
MADKVFAGLQLPNLDGAVAREADAGFVRIFFYDGELYCRDDQGEIFELAKGKKKKIEDLVDDYYGDDDDDDDD